MTSKKRTFAFLVNPEYPFMMKIEKTMAQEAAWKILQTLLHRRDFKSFWFILKPAMQLEIEQIIIDEIEKALE